MALVQQCGMRLMELVAKFIDSEHGLDVASNNTVVHGMALDSRSVQAGDCFIALLGSRIDGSQFIPQAVARGASAVLVDQSLQSSVTTATVPVIGVDNLSEHVSEIASLFYDNPSTKMRLIGFTGTNGKTTSSRLLADLLEQVAADADKGKSAFIGTMGYGVVGDCQRRPNLRDAAVLTTPDAVTMQGILAELEARGTRSVVLEVSSHSLVQHRVAGLNINTAVFTNLSRDHLDYHISMENYGAAKARLFAMPNLSHAIVNIDDPFGADLVDKIDSGIQVLTFSLQNKQADIYCTTIDLHGKGLSASVVTPWGSGELSTQLLGVFNLANLLAVVGAAAVEGIALVDIMDAIPLLQPITGRMEQVADSTTPMVVVDYAHTPNALENALCALREHCTGMLWVIFGCGGDRDAGKRAEMGKIAQCLADRVIVTSDNPRTECPQQIIDHILQGMTETVTIERNRRDAIRTAILSADIDDMVLIAGKGHESHQIIGTDHLPFDDRIEAHMALRQVGGLSRATDFLERTEGYAE